MDAPLREGDGFDEPALFKSLTLPPSTTCPLPSTRIKSDAFSVGQATPKGFTQKVVGSTGSWGLSALLLKSQKCMGQALP